MAKYVYDENKGSFVRRRLTFKRVLGAVVR